MEENVIGFDPGELTGFARMRIDAVLMEWGELDFDDMMDYCNDFDPEGVKAIIIEDFELFRKKAKAQIGSKFVTVQVIGALKAAARRHQIPVIMQKPVIKPIAERYSGIKPEGPHWKSHKIDAMNHCYYYLVQHYKAKTKLEKEQITNNPPA